MQVIGLGVIGAATAHFLSKTGHDVFGYDVVRKTVPGITVLPEPIPDADINFICTGEEYVDEAVGDLARLNATGLIVVRSTTPPKTVASLMEKYNRHIAHVPEFLRQNHAKHDAMHPPKVIIGQCCKPHGKQLKNIYSKTGAPVLVTDPTTSEMTKLLTNVLRASMISFWNEAHALNRHLNIPTKTLIKLVDPYKTLSRDAGGNWGTRFFGQKFEGRCLPKDLKMMIQLCRDNGVNPVFFQSVKRRNDLEPSASKKNPAPRRLVS